jgi:prepilin-type N-terminal cleavage/methylation domain-containing protein
MRARCGYTLVELSLTMAIVVTLAAIAVPRYGRAAASYRARAAAQRIVHDLALAQVTARNSSSPQSVVFAADRASYTISGQRHLDTGGATYRVVLSDEPYRASISSLTFRTGGLGMAVGPGSAGTVTFNGWGVPDREATIVVRSGSVSHTVLLDADTGRATAP